MWIGLVFSRVAKASGCCKTARCRGSIYLVMSAIVSRRNRSVKQVSPRIPCLTFLLVYLQNPGAHNIRHIDVDNQMEGKYC